MKKLLIVLSLLALSASAFAADVRWQFQDNMAGTNRFVVGDYSNVMFPTDLNRISFIQAASPSPLNDGENWLDGSRIIPKETPSVLSFTITGLTEDNYAYVDAMTITAYYYDEAKNYTSISGAGVERNGDEVQVFFEPTMNVAGLITVSMDLNMSPLEGPFNGMAISNMIVKEYKEEEPASETEIPEPAALAYAAMGLVSAFGLKRRVKK